MLPAMVHQVLTPINKDTPQRVGSYFLMATEKLAQHSPFSILYVSWLTLSWPYIRLYGPQSHGTVIKCFEFWTFGSWAPGEDFDWQVRPGLPPARFKAFAQGDPHQRFPSLLCFCGKSYLFFQGTLQCFPEVSFSCSPHSFFPSKKNSDTNSTHHRI